MYKGYYHLAPQTIYQPSAGSLLQSTRANVFIQREDSKCRGILHRRLFAPGCIVPHRSMGVAATNTFGGTISATATLTTTCSYHQFPMSMPVNRLLYYFIKRDQGAGRLTARFCREDRRVEKVAEELFEMLRYRCGIGRNRCDELRRASYARYHLF